MTLKSPYRLHSCIAQAKFVMNLMTSAHEIVFPWLKYPPVPPSSNKMELPAELAVHLAPFGKSAAPALPTASSPTVVLAPPGSRDWLLGHTADWTYGHPRNAPHFVRDLCLTQIKKPLFFPAVSMPCIWHETEPRFESTFLCYPFPSWSKREPWRLYLLLSVSTSPTKAGIWSQLRISDSYYHNNAMQCCSS